MVDNVQIKHATLNGKAIAYTSVSVFSVEVGRYSKGSYRPRYSFTGDLPRAVQYFNAINIGRGYKKRLVCWTLNKPVLAKVSS